MCFLPTSTQTNSHLLGLHDSHSSYQVSYTDSHRCLLKNLFLSPTTTIATFIYTADKLHHRHCSTKCPAHLLFFPLTFASRLSFLAAIFCVFGFCFFVQLLSQEISLRLPESQIILSIPIVPPSKLPPFSFIGIIFFVGPKVSRCIFVDKKKDWLPYQR